VDAVRIAGLKTAEIETVLGYEARSAMIHRDDLVVNHSGDQVGAGEQVTSGG
ncbi:MAG: glutamate 5-kinase, partial [Mesorhizobium sp.]